MASNYNNFNRFRSINRRHIIIYRWIVLFIIMFLIFNFGKLFVLNIIASMNIRNANKKFMMLQEKKFKLEEEKKKLQDYTYIEEIARKKLGLVKEGEIPIRIIKKGEK